jgi:DNA-binding transcriptional LysR family regulator
VDLKQIEAFVMVARLGSFAQAADFLCVSQPAISIRLSAFERELGHRLFDRTGRGVVLTAAGQEILVHATGIVTDAQAFRRSLGLPTFFANRIRSGTTDSFLRASLEPIISRFQSLNPSIALDLSVGDSNFVWDNLLGGKIDVGFHATARPHSSLRSLPLYETDLIWIAKPGVVEPEIGLTTQRLASFQIFTTRQGSLLFSSVTDLFLTGKIEGFRLCGIDSIEGITRFTEAGLGIAVLPRMVVQDRIESGRLIELVRGPALSPMTYMVSYRTDALSDAGRVLAEIASKR